MPKISTLPRQPKQSPYHYPPMSKLDIANALQLQHQTDFAVSPRGRTVISMKAPVSRSKASQEGTGVCKCTGNETVVYCFECHEYIPRSSEMRHIFYYLERESYHETWCCKDYDRNNFRAHANPVQSERQFEYTKWAWFGGLPPPWLKPAHIRSRMNATPFPTLIPARLHFATQTPDSSPQQTPAAQPTPAPARGLSPVGWKPSPSPAPVAGPSRATPTQAPHTTTPAAPAPQYQLNEAQEAELERMMFAAMDDYAARAAQEQQALRARWSSFGQLDTAAQPRPASNMQPSNMLQARDGFSAPPAASGAFSGSSLQASIPQHLLDQTQRASPQVTSGARTSTPVVPSSTPHRRNQAAEPQMQFVNMHQAYDNASASRAFAGSSLQVPVSQHLLNPMQRAGPRNARATETPTPVVPSSTPRPQSSAAQAQAPPGTQYGQMPTAGPSRATPAPQQNQKMLQHVQPLRRHAIWTAQDAPSPAHEDLYPSAPLAGSSSATPPVPSQNRRQHALGRYATWTAQESAPRAHSPAPPVPIARSANASALGRHATWAAPQASSSTPRAPSRAAGPMHPGPSSTPQPYGSLSPSPVPIAGSSGAGQQVAVVAQQQQQQNRGQQAPTAFGRHATWVAPQVPSGAPQQQSQQSRAAQPRAIPVQNGLARTHHPQTYRDMQAFALAHASPLAHPSPLSVFPPLAPQPAPSTQHHVPRPTSPSAQTPARAGRASFGESRASFGESRAAKPPSLDLSGLSATARFEEQQALRAQVVQIMGALRCDQEEALRVLREVRQGVPAS